MPKTYSNSTLNYFNTNIIDYLQNFSATFISHIVSWLWNNKFDIVLEFLHSDTTKHLTMFDMFSQSDFVMIDLPNIICTQLTTAI
jgi:hypothetical protein